MFLTFDPARVFTPAFLGQSGVIAPFLVTDEGVITFDMSATLASGETITGLTSFALEVAGPGADYPYVTDPDTAARIVTAAENTTTSLLVELGNWQQNYPLIQYSLNFQYVTSLSPSRSVSATVQVVQTPKFRAPPALQPNGLT